jgi:hypothetical protein
MAQRRGKNGQREKTICRRYALGGNEDDEEGADGEKQVVEEVKSGHAMEVVRNGRDGVDRLGADE